MTSNKMVSTRTTGELRFVRITCPCGKEFRGDNAEERGYTHMGKCRRPVKGIGSIEGITIVKGRIRS